MARLVAKTPAQDLVPVEIGGCRLDERNVEAITWIAPFVGSEGAVSDSLGLPFPEPGQMTDGGGRTAIWVGPGQAIVLGSAIPPEGAAVADQSSGWAILTLTGASSRDVLARLTPLDLRENAFPERATARTLIGHMTASLTRTGPETYEVMVFRSMAATAVHDLARAMKGVAARGAL